MVFNIEYYYSVISNLINDKDLLNLKKFIKDNKIKLREWNGTDKDILVLAILKNTSVNIISYILDECQYESINYDIKDKLSSKNISKYNRYEFIPLYLSIARNEFEISDILIKNNADINYDDGIIIKSLFRFGLMETKKLDYMMKNSLNVKWLLNIALFNKKEDIKILRAVLTYTGISNGHIIQLLNHYKNKIPLATKYIHNVLIKDKNKVMVEEKILTKSIENKKFEYIDYLLKYENENKEKLIDHVNNNISSTDSLFSSIKNDNKKILDLLVSNGLDVNSMDSDGHSPLLYAIKHKISYYVNYLFRNGAVINSTIIQYIHNNIIILKSFMNDFNIIDKLIKGGLNINQEDDEGNTLLIYALKKRDYNIILYLLKHNADIKIINMNIEKLKLLQFNKIFFNEENKKMLDILIKYGLDINSKDDDNNTPLIYAIYYENRNLVSYFLNHQASVQSVNEKIVIVDSLIVNEKLKYYYYIPSEKRIRKDDILRMLVNHGLNVNSIDNEGKSLIDYAIEKNNKEALNLFLNHHGSIDYINNDIRLIKSLIAKKEENEYLYSNCKLKLELLNSLINHGLDIKRRDNNGKNLLMYAIDEKNDIAIDFLVDHGINVDLKIDQNKKLFFELISNLNFDMTHFFNHIMENINEINYLNISIFESLSKCSNNCTIINILNILIKNGLKIDNVDKEGNTILIYFIKSKNIDVTNYLLKLSKKIDIHSSKYLSEHVNILKFLIKPKSLNLLTLKTFVEHGFNINSTDEDGNTLLVYAFEEKNESIIKYLLENHASIWSLNSKIEYIKPFLFMENSIFYNKKIINILKILIQQGLNVNAEDNEGNSLLLYAIEAKNESIINYLLENHASIESVNAKIKCLKSLILVENSVTNEKKYFKILKMLVSQGLNINTKDNEGNTLLVYAFEEKNESLINYLLENHASIGSLNSKIEYIKPFLFMENSTFYNKKIINTLKILIQQGLNINAKDNEGNTLLIYAIEAKNVSIIYYLLENHASMKSVNAKIEYIKPFLFMGNNIINNKKIINILKMLIQQGLNVNAKDNEGNTLLLYAIEAKNESVIHYLLENHASIVPLNSKIENLKPLISKKNISFYNKNNSIKFINIFKMLVQHGLNINTKDKEGNTLLTYAIEAKDIFLINYLLENHASVELINSKIEIFKSLIINSINNNLDNKILKILIEYGLNVNSNQTLLYNAIYEDNTKIINYLFDCGMTINIKDQNGKLLLKRKDLYYENSEVHHLITNLLSDELCISMINNNIKLIKPLFYSIQRESVVLKLLIQNGLNVNAIDEDCHSLLYYAIESEFIEIINCLFKYGAKIDFLYNDIKIITNLFIHTTERNDQIRFNILKILVDNGLNIYYEDNEGNNSVRYTIGSSKVNIKSVNDDYNDDDYYYHYKDKCFLDHYNHNNDEYIHYIDYEDYQDYYYNDIYYQFTKKKYHKINYKNKKFPHINRKKCSYIKSKKRFYKNKISIIPIKQKLY